MFPLAHTREYTHHLAHFTEARVPLEKPVEEHAVAGHTGCAEETEDDVINARYVRWLGLEVVCDDRRVSMYARNQFSVGHMFQDRAHSGMIGVFLQQTINGRRVDVVVHFDTTGFQIVKHL